MERSTHDGHCQICDRLHRAPKGKMAKHGYSVQWNQFVGQCPGSNQLPFEQSKELIDNAIAMALAAARGLKTRAAGVRAGKLGSWFHEYIESDKRLTRMSPSYQWTRIVIVEDASGDNWKRTVFEVLNDGTTQKRQLSGNAIRCIQQDRQWDQAQENDQYAKELARDASYREQYAKWQTERIADWKQKPLPARKED